MRKKGFFDNQVYMLHRNLVYRLRAFQHYGGSDYECACCHAREFSFLTIDHIAGGGNEERESKLGSKLAAGHDFYLWLKKSGFPDGYQVLCMNCQVGRRDNGGNCPHGGTVLTPQKKLEKFEVLRVGNGNFELTQTPEYQAAFVAVKRKGDARPEDIERRKSRRRAATGKQV